MPSTKEYFKKLPLSINEVTLPEKFTFPFFYEAHPLAVMAAAQVQEYLETQNDWTHNFGLNPDDEGMVIGKMFGVLVVVNEQNELGFIAAFSGKLADSNDHDYFVPPVYDMLQDNIHFLPEIRYINTINQKIKDFETDTNYISTKTHYEQLVIDTERDIQLFKEAMATAKKERKAIRESQKNTLTPEAFQQLDEKLIQESLKNKYNFKQFIKEKDQILTEAKEAFDKLETLLNRYKNERKQKSFESQQRLFDKYTFLNALGEEKSLKTIFTTERNIAPPAGAGECAAPKLLHYAYAHQLTPIALAEFWWGQSPKSEIRKHKVFYPACRGKCEPILTFMMEGLKVEDNPLVQNNGADKAIEVVYEDEHLILVNKPESLLSVPGKIITDSVQTRIVEKYPEAILVHRLDQGTSGLILIGKNKEIHYNLQYQFLKRTVKKRYVALLEGKIKNTKGIIDLPLRLDIDNRPHHMVCYQHGKKARTEYEVVAEEGNYTRIHFYPITGRTHQLRIHASHTDGLNAPIVGDDMYGNKGERLHLHAAYLEFTHPITQQRLHFEVAPNF